MDHIKTIAVLMTCHNRRETTLECLRLLYGQALPDGVDLRTYLVDDGCTDGTGDAVREVFSDVKILKGCGDLYWSGGMRLAWTEAAKGDYDYYLWLNDDTMLLPGAIKTILKSAGEIFQQNECDSIIVGSCCDPKTRQHTYGGFVKRNQRTLIPDCRVSPTDQMLPCDTMNGNIVLVPRSITNVIGYISPEYVHYGGDNDYGLRAKKSGFAIWIAPGYQGSCSRQSYRLWADPQVPFRKRWQYLHSPKGQPPYEVYVFGKRHCGGFGLILLVKLYLLVFVPKWYAKLRKLIKS